MSIYKKDPLYTEFNYYCNQCNNPMTGFEHGELDGICSDCRREAMEELHRDADMYDGSFEEEHF